MLSLPTVLLVEDDPGHARLLNINLRRRNPDLTLIHVSDGREALDYLHCENQFAGQTLPHHLLMVLDLNMPLVDGFQVLAELKKDAHLDAIPRIIMTTSDENGDIERCEQYGYLDYVVKPPDYDRLYEIIEGVALEAN